MNVSTSQQYKMYSAGVLSDSTNQETFDSINPSTGELFCVVANANVVDMQFAIENARKAFDDGQWSGLTVPERGIYLKGLAKLIRKHAKELASIESADTGKTSKQTTFIDIPTAADTFDYFGSLPADIFKEKLNPVAAPVKSLTAYEACGVVAAIIPWNYPLIMAAWKIAPALIAGNTVVLKPSALGCASIMRLAECAVELGFPEGVLNIIPSDRDDVAEMLVESSDVDMISFTGSSETGQKVLTSAAKNLKKAILELGGKSPTLVFEDCDKEAALGGVMSSIFMNQGQMCTAGSRLLIEESIYEDFLKRLIEKTASLKIGLAQHPTTAFGPIISADHRNNILKSIQDASDRGVTIEVGGKAPLSQECEKGFFLEPTIVSGMSTDDPIWQNEIFGPVLCVKSFSSDDEALRLANDSKYGLSASVWTKNVDRANTFSKKLECGTVWVNTYGGFYNEASFGGFKKSGFGRELGREGLFEYTRSKHVCRDSTPGAKPLVSSWF